MKENIRKLKNKYRGRAVAVLGGGPSLPDDLAQVPAGAVLISVNHHAFILVDCELMVFMDNPAGRNVSFQNAVATFRGVKISQTFYSDYELDGSGFWDGGFSSTLATWLACYLGGDPVLLCGMDCYQGPAKYFYHQTAVFSHPIYDYPLENHLKAWRPAMGKCPNSDVIRAVSGPLVEIFGEYNAND